MAKFSEKSLKFIKTHPSKDSFINILHGAVRSSKTWTMIPKLILGLNNYDVIGDRIIFGKTKDTIYNNILNQIFYFVGQSNYKYNRSNGELFLFGKRWNIIGAKDEASEEYIRGRTVGIAYGDELTLTPKSFTDMLFSRMSADNARFYATTNPDSPYHYVYTDYIIDEKKLAQGLVYAPKFTMDDNLSLSPEVRARYEALYKGVFYERFILGNWVIAEGAIYKDCYSTDLLYDNDSRPIDLHTTQYSHYIAIDYGTSNPTVYLFIIDDGETYWIDAEYYYDSRATTIQKTDAQYAEDLEAFIAKHSSLGNVQCVVDPAAASFKVELLHRNIWHSNAKNDVENGIRIVSSLLGKRKIRIHKDCVNLIRELVNYAWDEKAQKVGIDKPLKVNDHAPDALRYFCETLVPKYRYGGE